MKTRWMFLCLLVVASDAMAETEDPERDPGMVLCRASGGTNYDSDPAVVKRCQCPPRLDRPSDPDHGKQLVNGLEAEDLGCLIKPVGQLDRCFTWAELQCKPYQRVTRTVAGAPGQSCQERCLTWVPLATWDPAASEPKRCQPATPAADEAYMAGPCEIRLDPEALIDPDNPDFCQGMCRAQGALATWVPGAAELERCQPTDSATYVVGRCQVTPKPGEIRTVVETRVVEKRGAGIGGSPVHLGGGLYGVSLRTLRGTSVRVPLAGGPMFRLRLDLDDQEVAALVVEGAFLFNGKGDDIIDTPVGGFGAVAYEHRLPGARWLVLGAGAHLHTVGVDSVGDAFLTEFGGDGRVGFSFWKNRCRFLARVGGGSFIQDQIGGGMAGAGITCEGP